MQALQAPWLRSWRARRAVHSLWTLISVGITRASAGCMQFAKYAYPSPCNWSHDYHSHVTNYTDLGKHQSSRSWSYISTDYLDSIWKRHFSSLPSTGLSWVYEPYPTASPYLLGDSYWLYSHGLTPPTRWTRLICVVKNERTFFLAHGCRCCHW